MKRNKLLFCAASAVLTVSMLSAACGGPSTEKDGKTHFDWYVNISAFKDYENTLVDQVLDEKFEGMVIDFRDGSSGDDLLGMIMDRNLPDIVTVEVGKTELIQTMVESGQVYSLDELCEQYGVENFIPEDMRTLRGFDGKMYGVVSHFWNTNTPKEQLLSSNIMIARKDILDALNIDPAEITSLGALEDACAKYMASDLKSNDVVAYFDSTKGESWREYMAVDREYDESNLNAGDRGVESPKAGDFREWNATDETREIIARLNRFKTKGYLTENVLSGRLDEHTMLATSGAFIANINWPNCYVRLQESIRGGTEWVEVGPIRNDENDEPMLTPWTMNGYLETFVSKNCRNPEKAIKLLSFLYSDEGQVLSKFGIKGKTYDVDENGQYYYLKYYYDHTEEEMMREVGLGWLSVLLERTDFLYSVQAEPDDPAAQAVYNFLHYFSQWAYDDRLFNTLNPDSGDLAVLNNQIWGQFNWTKMVNAGSEAEAKKMFDSTWETMVNMKYQKCKTFMDERFHSKKDALGLDYAWPPFQK